MRECKIPNTNCLFNDSKWYLFFGRSYIVENFHKNFLQIYIIEYNIIIIINTITKCTTIVMLDGLFNISVKFKVVYSTHNGDFRFIII